MKHGVRVIPKTVFANLSKPLYNVIILKQLHTFTVLCLLIQLYIVDILQSHTQGLVF